MTALNATALAAIRDAGFTRAEWLRMHGYEGKWTGDECGCKDSRCTGHHHDGPDDCGCLPQLIADTVAWRTATRKLNSVELVGGPYGLNQWVTVLTPAVLVNVSTSRDCTYPPVNGVAREDPADSVVRIETREGWAATVTEEERYGVKQMVIRWARVAPEPVTETGKTA